MNRDFLKKYKIRIETIGPVFIGSGHELNKKEWILDRKRRKAYILDETEFFSYLNKRNLLDSYEKFMISNDDKRSLYAWANENGVMKDVAAISKYSLDCSDIADVNTVKGIQSFVKDGHGCPYIPGSSLKGALRNALLSERISRNKNQRITDEIRTESKNSIRDSKRFLANQSNRINQHAFYTKDLPDDIKPYDAVRDEMSGVRVSDSEPLSFNDITLCQKVDNNTEDRERDMPIFRECIKPGCVIESELTIDTTETKITIEEIKRAVSGFVDNYNRVFLSKFRSEVQYTGDVIYLGGGAGYHTKTVTSTQLEGERDSVEVTSKIIEGTLAKKAKNEHKHYRDKSLGVSPHIVKLTEYGGSLIQFGPCRIEFTEF